MTNETSTNSKAPIVIIVQPVIMAEGKLSEESMAYLQMQIKQAVEESYRNRQLELLIQQTLLDVCNQANGCAF